MCEPHPGPPRGFHTGRKDVSEQVPGERVQFQTSFLEHRGHAAPSLTKWPPLR